MCMIDSADYDPSGFTQTFERKARKEHVCCECGRTIHKGEKHQQSNNLYDGKFTRYRTCEHCVAAVSFLLVTCRGYLFAGAHEDLRDHWDESHEYRTMWLGRAISGMGNRWESKITGKLREPLREWLPHDLPFDHRSYHQRAETIHSAAFKVGTTTLYTAHDPEYPE